MLIIFILVYKIQAVANKPFPIVDIVFDCLLGVVCPKGLATCLILLMAIEPVQQKFPISIDAVLDPLYTSPKDPVNALTDYLQTFFLPTW